MMLVAVYPVSSLDSCFDSRSYVARASSGERRGATGVIAGISGDETVGDETVVPANDDLAKFPVWEKEMLLKARADPNNPTNEMGLSERIGQLLQSPRFRRISKVTEVTNRSTVGYTCNAAGY